MDSKTTKEPEVKTKFDILMIKKNIKLVNNIIQRMESDGKSDRFDFELQIMDELPEFYQSHPFLVKKLCKRDDLVMLYKMFDNLELVEKGDRSLAGVELKLGSELAEQYVYPKLDK